MTATNHILTGALIGGLVQKPLIALPLALVSHYLLDILPHYGDAKGDKLIFKRVLIGDSILSFLTLVWILVSNLPHAVLMVACGVVAAGPDLFWLPYFVAELRGQLKPYGWYSHFAHKIQWGERPWGMAVEVVWAVSMVAMIVRFV
jgi:hypothetical protein